MLLVILICPEEGLLFELKLKDFKSSFERTENGKCELCLSYFVAFFKVVFVVAISLCSLVSSIPWNGNKHETHPLMVDDIYNHQVSKFVFKCIYRLTPEQFHDWYKLTCVMHEHSTRSNFNVNEGIVINNLFAPSANTSNYGLKQLIVSGPRIWNKLPSDLKNVSSLNAFLKKLKLYYISKYS